MNIKTLLTALMALGLSAASSAIAADAKLEFWTFSMKPKFAPYFKSVVRSSEAANPGVKSEWNDFPWDVASKTDEFPLSVGHLYMRGTFGSSTRVIAAGTILTILPTLAAFLFTQRFFMRGMHGAVK